MLRLDFGDVLLNGTINDVGDVPLHHFLAVGCSHTAGVGIKPNECYISKLQQHYGIKIYNLAQPGGNHTLCNLNILSWLSKGFCPHLVIAQWPNPIRRIAWTDNLGILQNINNKDQIFDRILVAGEQNFYADWLLTIFNVNEICKAFKIKIINILLEDIDECYNQILISKNIILHQDKKIPGQSWIFDCASADGVHHSEKCHEQWKNRLIGLIDENTP